MAKKEIVCPFSGFEGQLLFKGEPAAGAKITRSYELFKDKGEETVIADDQGRFTFDSIFILFRTPFLAPIEFLSYQAIHVDYLHEKYHIWSASKEEKNEFSELGGKYRSVRCEITEEPQRVDVDNDLLVTSCRW